MASVHLVAGREEWAGRSRRPASAGQQGRDQAGFGSWLRHAREARGLTIDDIARETKIPPRHLESLEHGCLDVVPAFYQRAEVRAVARAVGVDEGLAVGRLECAVRPVVEPMVEPAPSTTPPSDLSWTLTLAGGTLALGALLWMAARIDYALPGLPKQSPGLGAVSSKVTAPQPEPVAPPISTAPTVAPTVAAAVAATEGDVPVPSVTGPFVTEPSVTERSVIGPSVTELVIRTEPPGAHVTVNGVGWGVSPVTIQHLSPGGKHIRVTREGFTATERALTLDEGQRRTMDLRLRPIE